jgi:hypothetical protein
LVLTLTAPGEVNIDFNDFDVNFGKTLYAQDFFNAYILIILSKKSSQGHLILTVYSNHLKAGEQSYVKSLHCQCSASAVPVHIPTPSPRPLPVLR